MPTGTLETGGRRPPARWLRGRRNVRHGSDNAALDARLDFVVDLDLVDHDHDLRDVRQVCVRHARRHRGFQYPGDNPRITRDNGLFVSCAGADRVQVRVGREQPALVVEFDGALSRFVQGNSAVVGPYLVTLIAQSGNGGRQINFELALHQ